MPARTALLSARTCRAEDLSPGCTAASAPLVDACLPNPDVLASACVRTPSPLPKAMLAWSDDDGLTWSNLSLGATPEETTVALDLVAGPSEDTVSVLYLAPGTVLRVATFDAQTATLRREWRPSLPGARLEVGLALGGGGRSVAYCSAAGLVAVATQP